MFTVCISELQMKPEHQSQRIFGMTRAKGKMFEFGVPIDSHLSLPSGTRPASLLPLAVGILGDIAAQINANSEPELSSLEFSASFFDAFLESHYEDDVASEMSLLAAAAYYLVGRPGSSRVIAERHKHVKPLSPVEGLLRWALCDPRDPWFLVEGEHSQLVERVAESLQDHFLHGNNPNLVIDTATEVRDSAYASRSARDLLLADVLLAVVGRKLRASSWNNLPAMSDLSVSAWSSAIQEVHFPKELWPAQLDIGESGLFRGVSGVIQMPTSAGKTRSLEMVLRAGFLSDRVRIAVIIVPFRALSHEIANSMTAAFRNDSDVDVNEFSEALQEDFVLEIEQIFGSIFEANATYNVLIATPEKFQFIVRQHPDIIPQLDLIVCDEAHQFDSGKRGVTYELLLTELKAALGVRCQIVALSAVMQNVQDLRSWLLGEKGVVVDGSGLVPTARATAFANRLEKRGQLQFFESNDYQHPDFFVPRVIDEYKLERRGKEINQRHFPDRAKQYSVDDVALQLGFKVVSNGAVAIFAGTKVSAAKIARRAVDVFDRGLPLERPVVDSDIEEVARLARLTELHFGDSNYHYKAARLGIFVHHGNTPNGLRLSIEHAMQNELIKFVICTSTLAQGVNLPIRYLIVSSTRQGEHRMKVRDFQNLLGRVGRAGIHTEGLVIFADPKIYDHRNYNSEEFRQATFLLNPVNAENTSSSLLSIVQPTGALARFSPMQIAEVVSAATLSSDSIEDASFGKELKARRALLGAVESYLMANRNPESLSSFREEAMWLCEQTLAYSLASALERPALEYLFANAADRIESRVQSREQQEAFGKTLLSVQKAQQIFQWVQVHQQELLEADTKDELFATLWPLLLEMFESSFASSLEPESAAKSITKAWMDGENYQSIFDLAKYKGFTKPHGSIRHNINERDIINFLDNEVSFDSALVVSAVSQFIEDDIFVDTEALDFFHKSLKYGISGELAISIYEAGFADREIAMLMERQLEQAGYAASDIDFALASNYPELERILIDLPGYFTEVLRAYSPRH